MEENRKILTQDYSNLRASVDDLVASVEELGNAAANYSEAELDAARERIRLQLWLARRQVQDYGDALQTQFCSVAQRTQQCIETHPWHAVGFAALAGLLVGKCMGSDSRASYRDDY